MRAALALALVACGGTPPRHDTPVEIPHHAPPAAPTCEEAGIIMRGDVEAPATEAGPAKEHAIAESCTSDHWPQAIIACVAASTNPDDCLNQLTTSQREGYDKRIAAWAMKYGHTADDQPVQATCFDALHAIGLFDPPINDTSPEREWQTTVRQRTLSDFCGSDGWSDDEMACLRDATTEAATGACVANLDPKVHARLLAIRDLAKTIETLRKTPAQLECPKVAEHHYSDAKTKKDLAKLKPADRKRLVAGVRKTMSDACMTDAWDEPTRACMIADGGEEMCFGSVRWGTVAARGQLYTLPACVDYAKAVSDLQQCSNAPVETRAAMQTALQQVDESVVLQATPAQKKQLETACQTGANTVRAVTANYGC